LGYPAQFYDPTIYSTLLSRVIYVPKDLKTNATQSWHFTVQRELPWGMLLDAGYVGNISTHIQVLGDYNQAVPNLPGQNVPLQNRRPISNYSLLQIEFSGATSTYEALQVKLEKRHGNGLFFINSFTWSKALDNAPGHAEVSNGDDKGVNYRDLRSSKGNSNYDQPFANTTSLIWNIPIRGASGKTAWARIAGGATRNWQFTAINTILSGQPINLTYSPSSAFQVSTLPPIYRPNLIGDPLMPAGQRSVTAYLNPNTVVIPTDVSHPFGNAGRNDVFSNALIQLDAGIHKVFPVYKERTRLDFRLEAFNAFNRTNFSPANGNRSSAAFGTIANTFPARQVQIALKLLF
jgi:hypothetical protein